jgi:drug/metabolite transporter (DMT)-like permease
MPRSSKLLAYLALGAGILALTFSGFFVHWADVPGTVTSFFRMAFASLIQAPFCFIRHQKSNKQAEISNRWILFAVLAGIFTSFDHAFWATALATTTIATATFLGYIAPLWVAVFSVVVWKVRLKTIFWIGLILSLIGAFVIFGNDFLNNPRFTSGDSFAFISSFFYAAYFLAVQKGRVRADTVQFVWWVTSTAAISLFFINLFLGIPFGGYPMKTILVFLGAAVLSQTIGYYSVVYALGHLPAAIVAPTMIGQPILSGLLAVPLLGEALQVGQIFGGLSVLAGIYVVNRSEDP